MTEETSEKLPVSDFYKVIDYISIFKSEKWWEAIVVLQSLGRRSIGLYLWHNQDGTWKRKHKFNIRNIDEWNKLKSAIQRLAPKLLTK